jgi:hypothetical protein
VFLLMTLLKRTLMVSFMILAVVSLAAVGIATPIPTATATKTPSRTSIPPSITPIPSAIPSPTNTDTTSPEPDLAPNCKITNEAGQIYLLSDQEFRDLRTTPGKLDQVLTINYPEWANYTQMVPSSTQPVNLGKIIVSASLDEESNLQINAAVTLVTLGDSLDWQLPSNTDLYLKSQEISTELNRLSLDWENTFDDSLRNRYPEVANSGTYALYIFFNSKLDRLQRWCSTYQQLFGTPP